MLVRLNDWKNRNLMPRIQQFKNRSLELLNDTKVWLQTGHNVKHMAITAGAGFVTLALLWSATKYAPTESMTFFLKGNSSFWWDFYSLLDRIVIRKPFFYFHHCFSFNR